MKLTVIFSYFRVSYKDALINDLGYIQDRINLSSSNNQKVRLLIPEMVQATPVRNLCSLQKQWEQWLSSFKKQRAIQQAAIRYTHLLQIIQFICMWNRSTSFNHIVQHPRESRISDYSIRIKQTKKSNVLFWVGQAYIEQWKREVEEEKSELNTQKQGTWV